MDLYPPPKYRKIIEPFAGSARYALKYFDREVLLVDKYDVVVKVWKYLQKCTTKDILGLPKLSTGMKIDELNLAEEEAMFLGLLAGISSTQPRNKVSVFSGEQNGRKNKMKSIADQLYKIKHWIIIQGCYTEIENQEATWFIDPPYQFGGHAYMESDIDFTSLGEWCKSRSGQAIVCENSKATWMDFQPMTKMRGGNLKYGEECIWSNIPTAFDYQQQKLFT